MYSKNGSIPKLETDGTDGWIEVPDAPEAPEGKEVIWWYPPGWVIRDPKPVGNWSWSQSQEQWVEIVQVTEQIQVITSESISSLDSSDISSLTSSQISTL
jgi:hypothetical protein